MMRRITARNNECMVIVLSFFFLKVVSRLRGKISG